MEKSDAATDVGSVNSAALQKEHDSTPPHTAAPSEKTTTAPITDPAADETSDEALGGPLQEVATEYPAPWRLFLISVALCLAVFCMALVSLHSTHTKQL